MSAAVGTGLFSRQRTRRSAIGINKVSDMLGHGLARNVAPGLNFLSDVFGNVVCPMLQSIEGYDASRVIKLPRHKVTDDGFEIRSLDLGLAENAAGAKAINYEINRLIRAIRHGFGDQPVLGVCSICSTPKRHVAIRPVVVSLH